MKGTVLAFRPGTGSGAIVTESGATYTFDARSGAADLQGGDLVSFETTASGAARSVRLVQRWSERRNSNEGPLVRTLYSTLQTAASPR